MNGITGAIISWDHELDELLNPHLTKTSSVGQPIEPIVLAKRIEAEDPRVQVTYFDFATEPGHSLSIWVEPLLNPATGELYEPGYNQVFVDPVTGQTLGRREWGAVWPVTTETLVSFLYKLHYSLHFPPVLGIDKWGIWFLGAIAFIWTIDCFTGFYLTLPLPRATKKTDQPQRSSYWSRWKPAWKIRRNRGPFVLNFDLHRAFGLWTWVLLLVIAFTGFSLNLYREIFHPVMTLVSDVTPTALDTRKPTGPLKPVVAVLSFEEAIAKGSLEAQQRGWLEPAGSLWHAREFGMYRVEFFSPDADHGVGGAGHKAIFIDSRSGETLDDWQPWQGTFADLFVQAQFPVHSGRILGLTGRILISLMGIVIAGLSISGVIIWRRKYKARILRGSSGEA